MKKAAIIALGYIILLGILVSYINKYNKTLELYKTEVVNRKAAQAEAEGKYQLYKLTAAQFESHKDSTSLRIQEILKENDIKTKKINYLEYQLSRVKTTDTLYIPGEPIFIQEDFILDTIINKEPYYICNIHLAYPGTIAITPEFKLERTIVFSSKKETINPPKKFFIARWFQKKHIVCEIEVIDENPYLIEESSKFIEFIK